MEALLTAYGITGFYVTLRSLQQLNVVHGRYWWLLPMSMGMAFCDYYLINLVVKAGPSIILACGLGGASGAAIGITLDKYFRSKHESSKASKGVRDRQSAEPGCPSSCTGYP